MVGLYSEVGGGGGGGEGEAYSRKRGNARRTEKKSNFVVLKVLLNNTIK